VERLTPLADAFLEAEDVDSRASLAIGSFAIFEGPPPPFEDFVATIAGRLPLLPRYRQRLREVPLHLAAPAWVDDPDFDIRWHIRNTALPAPGGRAEIGRLFSRVMASRMDRSRPLWEYWFVEGLEGGRWGLLSKLHHSLVDGISGSEIHKLVLDPTRTPLAPLPDTWQPAPAESLLAFTVGALWELASSPVEGLRGVSRALRSSGGRLLRSVPDSAKGLLAIASAARPVPDTSLTGPLHGSRRYTWTEIPLSDIRAVRTAYGVTLNDVALAVVTGGFRRVLLARGETPDAHAIRSLVPVSTREPGLEGIPDNRVTMMLPYLPVDLAGPVARLAAVAERIRSLRGRHEPEAGATITTAAGYGPFPLVSWGMRSGFRLPQRQIATVTTNVPGPRQTLYGLGRKVEALLPYVPIADRVRIGIAIFSYRETLTFGITADYDTTPDIDVLADGISESMQELLDMERPSLHTGD
jgi:diacylglycerol O-acyltransferase